MFISCLALSLLAHLPPNFLSLRDAEQIALARHARAVGARLDVAFGEALLEAAGRFANPSLGYQATNLVIGTGYDQEQNVHPKFFDQSIQQIEISKSFDIWWQRGPKKRAAKLASSAKGALAQEATRSLIRDVRLAYAALLREGEELALARSASARFSKSVGLMRRRYELGDVAETTLLQLELEGMHVANAEVLAEGEWAQAQRDLAGLMLVEDANQVGHALCPNDIKDLVPRAEASTRGTREQLIGRALSLRADVCALTLEQRSEGEALAYQKRLSLPPVELGLHYTRSKFQVSGDNPHVVGIALHVGLPLFDRKQLEIKQSRLTSARLTAEKENLKVAVAHQIHAAIDASERARKLLSQYEEGGMLARAEKILAAQEGQMRQGAISLLHFLEAERTFYETRADFLRTHFERSRAAIVLLYELGEEQNL